MRVSERGQPGSSCTGVFGGRPDGPGWFVLVGREGMGQPCCANPRSDLEECKIHLGSIVRAGSSRGQFPPVKLGLTRVQIPVFIVEVIIE